MSEKQQIQTSKNRNEFAKRGKRPGVELFPRIPLKRALEIPKAIWEHNGGNPFNILDLAPSIEMSPTSSSFLKLLAASYRYGLTVGSMQTKVASLTELGKAVVAPIADTDTNFELKQALLNNTLFKKVYSQFDGKPIPRNEVLRNTLLHPIESGGVGIPREDVDSFIEIFMKNITDYNLNQDINGTVYLRLDRLSDKTEAETTELPDIEHNDEQKEKSSGEETKPLNETEQKPHPKQIFVAHGKNTKPLEQLKAILDQFEVPYKVAIDEPNQGRPISQKVSELMNECSSSIFIFTKDEETQDLEGNTVYRPSDNVVYELGAASAMFGKKIVIFKENGVSFGSDFKDLGYISFDTDQLGAKTIELMKELVGFGLLKVSAA